MLNKLLNTKLFIKFFEWLYFPDIHDPCSQPWKERIVKVKAWDVFLMDKCYGTKFDKPTQRMTVSPVWNWGRLLTIFLRIFDSPPKLGEYYCTHCQCVVPFDRVTYMHRNVSTTAISSDYTIQTIPLIYSLSGIMDACPHCRNEIFRSLV